MWPRLLTNPNSDSWMDLETATALEDLEGHWRSTSSNATTDGHQLPGVETTSAAATATFAATTSTGYKPGKGIRSFTSKKTHAPIEFDQLLEGLLDPNDSLIYVAPHVEYKQSTAGLFSGEYIESFSHA